MSGYNPSKISGILAVVLAVACLAIKAQSVGVQVDTAGANVVEPIRYPKSALENAANGTVVAQVDVDAQGNVTDARVLSGPQELRKAVLKPVLTWQFKPDASSGTRQVSATFTVPSKEDLEKDQASEDTEMLRNRETLQNLEASQAALRAQMEGLRQSTALSVDDAKRQAQMNEAMAAQMALLQDQDNILRDAYKGKQEYWEVGEMQRRQMQTVIRRTEEELRDMQRRVTVAGRVLSRIDISGLSDEQRNELMRQLPAKVGDTLSVEAIPNIRRTIRKFQEHIEHLTFELRNTENDGVALKITVPAFQQLTYLEQEINEVEAQMDRMRKTYTDSHPDVQALRYRLERLKQKQDELTK
jgi:TonB family protein